ncbi:thioredoxin [Salix suchowensis]|nr:thioredoxin [Salix suchowensis]
MVPSNSSCGNQLCVRGVYPRCVLSQCFISADTQQSFTDLSSNASICRLPFLMRCSIAATSREDTEADCWRNVKRMKRKNLGCAEGGLVDAFVEHFSHGTRESVGSEFAGTVMLRRSNGRTSPDLDREFRESTRDSELFPPSLTQKSTLMVVKALTTLPAFRQAVSITKYHLSNSLMTISQPTDNASRPAMVDFWATWCGPCRVISPVFEKFSSTTSKVDFYKVDVDECPDIAQEVGIRAMPTFMAFKKGSNIGTVVGADPSALKSKLHVPSRVIVSVIAGFRMSPLHSSALPPPMSVKEITKLADFNAAQFAGEAGQGVEFYKVNVDECDDISQEVGIRSVGNSRSADLPILQRAAFVPVVTNVLGVQGWYEGQRARGSRSQ